MSGIPFIDLDAQRRRLGERIPRAIERVLSHGGFIMGPEVAELERRLAAFCGAGQCVSCANGTDALQLVLMAEGVGPGDAVFVPAFTFVATAEVVPPTGATPVFVDVRAGDFTLDPASLEAAVGHARALGLKPRMVIAVDLFGHPADYQAIAAIAGREGMVVLADAAQGFGATYRGGTVGTLAAWTTTSFFPAKPLGCYGDGGAVFTDDPGRAELLRSLRVHGKGQDKYDNVRIGVNSRLDTLQAAILLEKLAIFADEIAACRAAGVPTAIYYPIPLHRQTGYLAHPTAPGGLPVSERLARQVVSLPMHPYLDEATQDRVIAAVRAGLGG